MTQMDKTEDKRVKTVDLRKSETIQMESKGEEQNNTIIDNIIIMKKKKQKNNNNNERI